jgi:transmembrane 9 superfamily member 2/4
VVGKRVQKMFQKFLLSFLSLIVAWATISNASFYLPGVSPDSYENAEAVKLFVTKLTSTKTQIPYDYYSLNFCKPKHAKEQSENLGEVLSGDRIENSVYKVCTSCFLTSVTASLSLIDLYERTQIL